MGRVRTRFAPSPTGALHLGGARTALFNWLFARAGNGSFVLRAEDTDAARSSLPSEAAILESLKWLGLSWDEGPDIGGAAGPYRQSERLGIYRQEAERLLQGGKAYECYCSRQRLSELKAAQAAAGQPSRYDGRCRGLAPGKAPEGASPVVRFKVPPGQVRFTDGVHGELAFEAGSIGDFVIIGSDMAASYNFAAAVDDALMGITHVIRGDDHLPNTPRQILLLKALGLGLPSYSHVPLVLGPDRTPLSKRHGAVSIEQLRDEGYLPEAVLNALARLGWNPGEGALGLDEMAARFTLEGLSRSASSFDADRLRAYNKESILSSSAQRLAALAFPGEPAAKGERLRELAEALKGNASTIKELARLMGPFIGEPAPGRDELAELSQERSRKAVAAFRAALESVGPGPLDFALVLRKASEAAGEKGGRLMMPVRLALTGMRDGIGLEGVIRLLGRQEAAQRLARRE